MPNKKRTTFFWKIITGLVLFVFSGLTFEYWGNLTSDKFKNLVIKIFGEQYVLPVLLSFLFISALLFILAFIYDKTSVPVDKENGFPKFLTTNFPSISKLDIIGRKSEFKKLRNSLLNEKTTALLNGMGGIGKTTLASVYVNEFQNDYSHILWLTIKNSLKDAILSNISLLNNLKIPTEKPEQIFELTLNQLGNLSGDKPNLLILDNANENLSPDYNKLPLNTNWHILVTSRERLNNFPIIELGFLNEEEAIQLFKMHCKLFDVDQIRSIVNMVELHTLTIELLSKSADRNHWSFYQIQEALKRDAIGDVSVPHSDNEKIARIKSYLTSIFNISKLNDDEKSLLKQFLALPNEWLSFEFLESLLKSEENDSFARSHENLCDKGYLQKSKENKIESYKMHPILVESLTEKLNPSANDLKNLIESVTDLLYVDESKDNPIDKYQFIIFGDSILNMFPEDSNKISSSSISELQIVLAYLYKYFSNYNKARYLVEKALETALKNFGDNHYIVSRYQSNLALIYKDLGDLSKARNLLEKAVVLDRKNFGESHFSVAISQSNLAMVYRDLGELEKALVLLEKALSINLKNFEVNHPSVAINQSNLATVYQDLGDLKKARDLLENALASFLINFGENHSSVAINQSNLALVYQDLGELQKARDLLEKALAFYLLNFEENHSSVAICQSNLALVYKDLGKPEKARDLLEKALATDLKNFSENHSSVARSQSNLATVYQALGELEKARKLSNSAYITFLKNLGPNHPNTKTVKEILDSLK